MGRVASSRITKAGRPVATAATNIVMAGATARSTQK
jgi:hypothetical protein